MHVLTIGIDGGTFKTLQPMMDLGIMPRLKEAMARGTYALAESVIPTNSAAAWSSIMTGLNPGKHGIFYFNELERTEAGPKWGRIVNFSSIHGTTLWKILGDHGLRVCVVNVPITYPPEDVNGILISGLLAPSESSNYTYPSELRNDLVDYKIDINLMDEDRPSKEDWYKHILREVTEITKVRNRNVISLLKKEDWDFVMVVYRETDDVQHFLWHVISQGLSKSGETTYFPLVKEYFSLLDSSIGELLDRMGEETDTFIISDHGFDAMPTRIFDLDSWARSRELQFYRSGYAQIRITALGLIRKIISNQNFAEIVKFVSQERKVANTLEFGVVKNKDNLINWQRTLAFKFGDGLALKLESMDDARMYSIKQAIRKDLISMVDPGEKSKPITDVVERDLVYKGPFSSRAPDLVVIPSAKYKLSTIPGTKMFENSPKIELTGEHDRHGIFIALGPNIRRSGQIDNVSILDFFPTLLELFNIDLPSDLDGKVLQSILIQTGPKEPRRLAEYAPAMTAKSMTEFSRSEEEDLRERLSRLGYL